MIDSLGQLIITGIEGLVLTDEEKKFIENEDIGGVIFFAKNYSSPTQLAELVNSIQTLRKEYPLFISVDQEGGRVIRFKNSFTQFPSMLEIAKTNSPKMCYEVHKISATELNACGINVSYSPVCDILTNPNNKVIGDRSFGNDPEEVSKFVSASIRGLQANGVLACAKHFPGHGDTIADSHFDLPVVKTSLENLKLNEFIPFSRASKSRVEFMMVAHLIVESIDSNLPTSLSPKTYQIIRDEIKFSKIIITDDLEMKAITNKYDIGDATVMALNAGTDIVLFQNIKSAQWSLNKIKEAVKTKVLKNKDIEQKLKRIFDCKKKNFSEYSPVYIPSITEKVGNKANLAFLQKLLKLTKG